MIHWNVGEAQFRDADAGAESRRQETRDKRRGELEAALRLCGSAGGEEHHQPTTSTHSHHLHLFLFSIALSIWFFFAFSYSDLGSFLIIGFVA